MDKKKTKSNKYFVRPDALDIEFVDPAPVLIVNAMKQPSEKQPITLSDPSQFFG